MDLSNGTYDNYIPIMNPSERKYNFVIIVFCILEFLAVLCSFCVHIFRTRNIVESIRDLEKCVENGLKEKQVKISKKTL